MATIAHDKVFVTTQQTRTGATTYADVTGLTLPSTSFVAGQKYLLLVSARISCSATAANIGVKLLHGSTDFATSEHSLQPDVIDGYYNWFWFHVWTAVSGESLKAQFKVFSAADTMKLDQGHLFVMRLDADLTEGTDWHFNENTTSTAIPNSPSYTTTNTPTITFTPGTASHDWLVFGMARHDPGQITVANKARLNHNSGTDVTPEIVREAEDATNDRHIESFARVFTLTAAAHTFEINSGSTGTASSDNRLSGAVFAINLNKFRNHGFVYNNAAADLTQTVAYAQTIETLSYTPDVAGDSLIIGQFIVAHNSATVTSKMRVQVDGADLVTGTTTDSYIENDHWDVVDNLPTMQIGIANLTAAAHTIDLDGSISSIAGSLEHKQRLLMAVSMELPSAGAGTDDVLMRFGPFGSETSGSGIVTALFAATAAAAAGAGYMNEYYKNLVQDLY